MHQITLANMKIDIIRKDIKNLHLGVYPPNGRVRIAAPMHFDDETLRLFAISKLPWIKKQQSKFQNQERQTLREYVSGESHYFNGQRYLLKIIDSSSPPSITIRNKKYIELHTRKTSTRLQREKIMTQWYRKQLKELLPPLIEKWQHITGIHVDSWHIKSMKTKWGSCCSPAKRIWLNLELAKKPIRCIEYIIVHEMVHMIERHHNERFVRYMDDFMPQWREYKKELNRLILGHTEWPPGVINH